MISRVRNTFGPVIGYHGYDRGVAERVLACEDELRPGQAEYDWLGAGVYFWIDSPLRAYNWASANRERLRISEPYVIGAYIYPGLCLNLTDYGIMGELKDAHSAFIKIRHAAGKAIPQNTKRVNGVNLVRRLDYAVIETTHMIRAQKKKPAFDTVVGIWEEGNAVYEGAEIRDLTHMQMAVRNPETIIGFFRVRGMSK